MAKCQYVIGSPGGSSFEARTDVYYEIRGEENLAVTALRGTPAHLWENSGLETEILAPRIHGFSFETEILEVEREYQLDLDYAHGQSAFITYTREEDLVESDGEHLINASASILPRVTLVNNEVTAVSFQFVYPGTYLLTLKVEGAGGEREKTIRVQVQ